METPETPDLIEAFFTERLRFTPVPEEKKNILGFDKLLNRNLQKWRKKKVELEPEAVTTEVVQDQDGSGSEFYTDDEECSSVESEPDEEHRKFKAFLQQKAIEQANFALDFDEVLDKLDEKTPEIPGKPQI